MQELETVATELLSSTERDISEAEIEHLKSIVGYFYSERLEERYVAVSLGLAKIGYKKTGSNEEISQILGLTQIHESESGYGSNYQVGVVQSLEALAESGFTISENQQIPEKMLRKLAAVGHQSYLEVFNQLKEMGYHSDDHRTHAHPPGKSQYQVTKIVALAKMNAKPALSALAAGGYTITCMSGRWSGTDVLRLDSDLLMVAIFNNSNVDFELYGKAAELLFAMGFEGTQRSYSQVIKLSRLANQESVRRLEQMKKDDVQFGKKLEWKDIKTINSYELPAQSRLYETR